MLGAYLRRGRCGARSSGGAWRGGGVGVALSVDAVVRGREDSIDLAERSNDLVEVEAERGEVVDRGLQHGPPRTDGDYSEAVRKMLLSSVMSEGRRDPGEDGRVWAWGVGEPGLLLAALLAYFAPEVGVAREGELDGRGLAGGAVDEERAGS